MNFTKEQLTIINSKKHSFKINAIAGSGKTTTLLEYAKQHPTLKILYLAYNKSLQTSLEEKLKNKNIFNMEIKTIHSLAFTKMHAWNYKITYEIKIDTIDKCIKEITKNFDSNASYLALIKDIINFYCNSSHIKIDEQLLQNYKKYSNLDAKTLKILQVKNSSILNHTKYILTCMRNHKIEATHDFYLKLFFLNKKISSTLEYDLILIDEAQDISDVMIAIVEMQNCKRVYVGDTFQQIYSFRYALNALDKINLPSYNLSKSFRFGDNLAKNIQETLNKLYIKKDLNQLYLTGIKEKTSKFGNNVVDKNKPFCVISRTSFALAKEVIKYLNEKKRKIFFEGGYNTYSFMNQTVYSIYYLKEKKFDKISLKEIAQFSSIEELEEYSKQTKNQDYLNVIKFVNTYQDNIFEINKQIKQCLTLNKNEAQIIFTTAHKAKGMEYSQVIMCENDFISYKDIINPKDNLSNIKIKEEINIYYVAATRTKDALNFANLKLDYTYTLEEENNFPSKVHNRRVPLKKLKQLENRWININKIANLP